MANSATWTSRSPAAASAAAHESPSLRARKLRSASSRTAGESSTRPTASTAWASSGVMIVLAGGAQTIGDRLGADGHLDERSLGGLGLCRRHVRQPTDRLAYRGADVGLRFDLQPRRKRRDDGFHRGGGRRLVAFPALCRLADGV